MVEVINLRSQDPVALARGVCQGVCTITHSLLNFAFSDFPSYGFTRELEKN